MSDTLCLPKPSGRVHPFADRELARAASAKGNATRKRQRELQRQVAAEVLTLSQNLPLPSPERLEFLLADLVRKAYILGSSERGERCMRLIELCTRSLRNLRMDTPTQSSESPTLKPLTK